MKHENYQGWSNYATWRINLEIVDGYQYDEEQTYRDENEFADYLKEYVEEIVTNESKGLAVDYALAFLADVNYKEIAISQIESNPQIIKP